MATEAENPTGEPEPPPSSESRSTPIPPPTLPPQAIASSPTPTASATPAGTTTISSIPQKRLLVDDDHLPTVRSPLNPDSARNPKPQQQQAPGQEDTPAMAREKRTKKESLKKRESKGVPGGSDSARATPEPRRKENGKIPEGLPMRYRPNGPLKPTDFDLPQGPVFRSHHVAEAFDGQSIEFFETSEQPLNRKGYVYECGIADPTFPSSLYYRQTEPKPHCAHFSFEDAAPYMYFDQEGKHVTGELGFRMARANVAVRQGSWYWECKIARGCIRDKQPGGPESHGHVRMGWARREASRDAPVGYDAYSYGLRDVAGQKVHMSRPKEFFPPGEDVQEGDVIGLEIRLPSESLHRKVVQGSYNPAVDMADDDPFGTAGEGPNIVRDRIPFRFQNTKVCFEKFDYHPIKELEDLMNPSPMTSSGPTGSSEPPNPNHPIPCLRTLPNSHIKIYKNGVLMGTPFTNLLAFLPPASSANSKLQEGAREGLDDGTLGYYPAVSVFRGGAAEVNFGPDFWYPPPDLEPPGEDDVIMVDAGVPPVAPAPPLAKLRPMAERYDEQIAEDIVYDIVDEVHFWMQDGGKTTDGATAAAAAAASATNARQGGKDQDVTMED